VLTDLKNRGVDDILVASVDGLTGFPDAIATIYPDTEHIRVFSPLQFKLAPQLYFYLHIGIAIL